MTEVGHGGFRLLESFGEVGQVQGRGVDNDEGEIYTSMHHNTLSHPLLYLITPLYWKGNIIFYLASEGTAGSLNPNDTHTITFLSQEIYIFLVKNTFNYLIRNFRKYIANMSHNDINRKVVNLKMFWTASVVRPLIYFHNKPYQTPTQPGYLKFLLLGS